MHRTPLAFALAIVLCATGCASRSGNRGGGPAPTQTPSPMAHIEVHGTINLVHDAAVKTCYVGKPGKTLLNGYSVTLQSDPLIEAAEVLVPGFTGEGSYKDSAELTLDVAQGPGFPHGTTLEERPESSLTVVIAASGKIGRAVFQNYHTLYGRNGDEKGGMVSGSIEWTCAQVERGQ
jgi:hypothetical protein